MRYFAANAVAYEIARQQLNAAWGLPRAGTATSLSTSAECMKDNAGNVFFCVDNWMCELDPAPALLAQAIADGQATELSETLMIEASNKWQSMP